MELLGQIRGEVEVLQGLRQQPGLLRRIRGRLGHPGSPVRRITQDAPVRRRQHMLPEKTLEFASHTSQWASSAPAKNIAVWRRAWKARSWTRGREDLILVFKSGHEAVVLKAVVMPGTKARRAHILPSYGLYRSEGPILPVSKRD